MMSSIIAFHIHYYPKNIFLFKLRGHVAAVQYSKSRVTLELKQNSEVERGSAESNRMSSVFKTISKKSEKQYSRCVRISLN